MEALKGWKMCVKITCVLNLDIIHLNYESAKSTFLLEAVMVVIVWQLDL
jgi:hypothetical protein